MKAKEIVRRYKEFFKAQEFDKAEELINNFIKELFLSIPQLFKQRNPDRGTTMIAIFREVENRWVSVANKTELPKEMFSEIMKEKFPDVYDFWSELKVNANYSKEKYEKRAKLLSSWN